MILRDAYINVQQGLQNIAAFVNKNIEIEEMDYFWKQSVYKFIELIFMSDKERMRAENVAFQEVQAVLDDLKILQYKNYTGSLVAFDNGKYLVLPDNYVHLLNDRTVVAKTCYECSQPVERTREIPNRLTETELLYNKLNNSQSKTSVDSPISEIDGLNIYVYNTYKGSEQFRINNIKIDYLKQPTDVTYNDVTFPNGTTVLEFPEQTCYKLIKCCIIYIAMVTQQNQQKIANLKNP